MRHVAGGDLPAEIWRRFMLAAHQGLPVRDFPFLGETAPAPPIAAQSPAAPAAERTEARQQFYQSLSGEFASANLDTDPAAEPSRK
jgi:penicillin-binding protein 1A